VFLSLKILTLIRGAIGPPFNTESVLLVLEPLTFVAGSVNMRVDASAVSLVVFPLALVNITVCVDQPSSSVGLIVLPVALIAGSIKPDLNTSSISHFSARDPFSLVLSSILEQHNGLLDSLKAIELGLTPVKRSQLSQDLKHRWIIVGLIVNFEVTTNEDIQARISIVVVASVIF